MTRASDILLEVSEALAGAELGLKESPWLYSQFGRQPRATLHRGFALAIDEEDDTPARRVAGERLIQATLKIKVAYQIRADAAVLDNRAAHDQAERVGDVLDLLTPVGNWSRFPVQVRHTDVGDGTFRVSEIFYQLRFLRESKVAHP